MSNFEVIEKAINEHGEAVEQLKSGIDARLFEIEQKMARRGESGESVLSSASKSVSSKVAADDQLEALRTRTVKSVSIPTTDSVVMLRKSVVGDAGGEDDSPYNVQPQR